MAQPTSPSGPPTGAGGGSAAENMLGLILQNLQLGQAQIAREQAAPTPALTETLKSLKSKPGVVEPEQLKGPHEEAGKHWKAGALDFARGKGDGPVTADNLVNSTITDIDAMYRHSTTLKVFESPKIDIDGTSFSIGLMGI